MAVLLGWIFLLMLVAPLLGLQWFNPGDFEYREAMYYHGIGISAWMLLILVSARLMLKPLGSTATTAINFGSVTAGFLAGVGGALIKQEGISNGTVVITIGMVLADITAWIVIALLARDTWLSGGRVNKLLERSALIAALVSMSLATPLGHLAGMAQDFSGNFPLFTLHVATIGAKADDVLNGYIGSHSHEVLAAFFAAVLVIPIINDFRERRPWQSTVEKIGLVTVLIATVAQTALYQYSAWLVWQPPTLFASGPNGMPLDDVILTIFGIGMLLLLPMFLPIMTEKTTKAIASYEPSIRTALAILFITFLVSIVGLGIYIEFHEGFFGGGEGNAPGVVNDLAFIRGHLLFGFMILPVLLVGLLCLKGQVPKKISTLASWIAIFTALLGSAGMYFWTFHLDATPMKLCYGAALLAFVVMIYGRWRSKFVLGLS